MANDRLIIRCAYCGADYDFASFGGDGFTVYDEYRAEGEDGIGPWLTEHLKCREKAVGLDKNTLNGNPGFIIIAEGRPPGLIPVALWDGAFHVLLAGYEPE